MNNYILSSIDVLSSKLDPTFYHYQIFLRVSDLKDKPMSSNTLEAINEHPLFLFVTSLLYQSLTQSNDFYIDKSVVLRHPVETEKEIQKIIPFIKEGSVLETVMKLSSNIQLMNNSISNNHSKSYNEMNFIMTSNWPSESKIIKLVQIDRNFNKLLPLRPLSTKIMTVLMRLERSFNYDLAFDDFISYCYEWALKVMQNELGKGRKRVLFENETIANIANKSGHFTCKRIKK